MRVEPVQTILHLGMLHWKTWLLTDRFELFDLERYLIGTLIALLSQEKLDDPHWRWKLIEMLRPIAKNHTERMMSAFLDIWLKTMHPADQASESFQTRALRQQKLKKNSGWDMELRLQNYDLT